MASTDKQELMLELKALDEELKKLNNHLQGMDEQLAELESSRQTVIEFSNLKKGDELRVPLSSGIYIKSNVMDEKKLMINVGAGVTVEKTPDDVLKILDSQFAELSGYREQLIGQMKILIERIDEIQSQVE